MTPECDLYIDAAQSGCENMHRDQSALELVTRKPLRSIVRIYRWETPTVSLGYFQKDDAEIDARLQHCPRVRRVTGGGAILHDDELTYSCVLPTSHSLCRTPIEIYSVIHTAIINLLRKCGVDCSMRQDVAPIQAESTGDPFLCFLRSDPRDVVLSGAKILGSAQRRRRGNVLQHGSILLRASNLTPEIPGIVDLCREFREEEFSRELPQTIAEAITDRYQLRDWPPEQA